MITTAHLIAAATPTAAHRFRHWLIHLGGLGLIPLGLLDSSVIPIPGSMDLGTMILAARGQEPWFYYALMATAGSVLGGYFTYRLARKGGKGTLERRFSRTQVEKIDKLIERWGFSAITVPAILPPPAPMVPFLLAAGAMQYPVKKFLAALALGRIVRYTILAYLAARYGRKIVSYIAHHAPSAALVVGGAAVATALLIFLVWRATRSAERPAL